MRTWCVLRPDLCQPRVQEPQLRPSASQPGRLLGDTRLPAINQVVATTGDDPELDALILRLHTETASCGKGSCGPMTAATSAY